MANADSLIGQQIGGYIVSSHLSRGGMADVYLADDVGLRRQVVLKIMLPHLAQNEAFITRFQREARTTARLNHPNIIQVYSTGLMADGRPYLAMQYIRGGTLHDKLTRLSQQSRLLPSGTALDTTIRVADALSAAHNAGIVHRDLKPSNILLHPDGTPVVTDLGIAAVDSTTRLTQTGEVMGTPYYMSPEQAQGKKLDGRSDIYSLGVILYETLAGNPPFQATSPLAVLHQHIYEPPPRLLSQRSDLSPITSQVVETCLRKNPNERYQHAADLVAALEKARAAEMVVPTPPYVSPAAATVLEKQTYQPPPLPEAPAKQPTEEAQPSSSARRIWWLFVPILLVICLASLWMGWKPLAAILGGGATPTAVIAAVPEEPAEEEMVGTDTETPAVEIATESPIPERVTPTPSETVPLTPTPTANLLPAPAPERNQIVFQSNRDGDHEIYIMEEDGSNQRKLTNNSSADQYPVVSPDGRKILFQSDRDGNQEVYVMNLDGSDQQRLTNTSSDEHLPTWSPDGSQIAFVSERDGNRNVYTMNADGSSVRQLTFDGSVKGHPSWSVNNQIAFNAGEVDGGTWEIYVMDADGEGLRQLTTNQVSDWAPEWSPDGSQILYNSSISKSDEAALFVMNADGSNSHLVFTSDDYEWGADWTPDGERIIFTRERGAYSYIYVMEPDGENVTLISERGSYPSWVE